VNKSCDYGFRAEAPTIRKYLSRFRGAPRARLVIGLSLAWAGSAGAHWRPSRGIVGHGGAHRTFMLTTDLSCLVSPAANGVLNLGVPREDAETVFPELPAVLPLSVYED
jgi:hypothetical protein